VVGEGLYCVARSSAWALGRGRSRRIPEQGQKLVPARGPHGLFHTYKYGLRKGETIMRTWLKVIGSGKDPITGHPFYGNYNISSVGFRKPTKPGIRMGDHLFLYAAGGSKRIFAMAEATGDPWYDNNRAPQDDCPWKLSVRYLMHCRVEAGIHIDEIGTDQRDLMLALRQASHIALSPEESRLAYSKLREKTDATLPDYVRRQAVGAAPSNEAPEDQSAAAQAIHQQLITEQEQQLVATGLFDPGNVRDARERIMASIVRRRGQPAFRRQLLRAYKCKCAISGCGVEATLDAAHIVPYKGPETNYPANG
jgi:hypothetical protein